MKTIVIVKCKAKDLTIEIKKQLAEANHFNLIKTF
jgi:hypothetical protein